MLCSCTAVPAATPRACAVLQQQQQTHSMWQGLQHTAWCVDYCFHVPTHAFLPAACTHRWRGKAAACHAHASQRCSQACCWCSQQPLRGHALQSTTKCAQFNNMKHAWKNPPWLAVSWRTLFQGLHARMSCGRPCPTCARTQTAVPCTHRCTLRSTSTWRWWQAPSMSCSS
jgi:hypothetical protein